MLENLIKFSLRNKPMVILFTLSVAGFGLYALTQIPIGAVPDVTNNQVQVITTSRNLATQDVEQFITYPIELEMANLPGVKEIRSVSKFGLSVVTIVFEDNLGTYLPRQLISEKIKSASEKIPPGFGSPFMGPITTGLGEIYQYILDVRPEYKMQYTPMELRTIQDWVVKRQLSGIPGVVEVNTWGGYLRQYEVSINPEKLRSMDVTVAEIFTSLQNNNSVSGGGYIEKTNESYFIRGEGLAKNAEDIENIVVANRGGLPIFIKDLAKVTFGYATRFGAITANGEGEKVMGQVMMLKDANSREVIESVKQRIDEVQKRLPKGLFINPILERSDLIDKTTSTITENLVLGCLIVIFVVVLLLGNLRSGLVVASVIPLSLLFAISLMYIYGIDANLMSLGAIDFGIIIDGAVIIVEFIAFQISSGSEGLKKLNVHDKRAAIDKITFDSAAKMMRSSVFGQLIILIVFIPILSLTNVEGKMFRPMALTFSFALLGTMIFCFTYVPVISSIFLKPEQKDKKTFSKKLMRFLEKLYRPSITWALEHKKTVISGAFGLLLVAGVLFSRMGGEFVPTLDEGDFVIQPVLKTGTSLSKTIEITTQMENILKKFPEVKQTVSRIGAAEVPTDPMSMEESDVIITLKPLSEWTTAASKDELAEKFKEALSEIPGIEYEFTQPIEMRFNELITGVRADLAIKVFGENLEVLNKTAREIKRVIENVEGASDITVEKVAGLPQMSVLFNRSKIAQHGLNVDDLNKVISMAFAGVPAGSIFEGEKQFDLVARFEKNYRQDLENLKNTYVPIPGGGQVPLQELADVTYTSGPAKISRDNTRRRIVVGVNVRNRDLESVVQDVQDLIESRVQLPPGYSISYGGQFENLRTARARLSLAVPIALILIFIMLHFAFRSIKDALMVYSAIPLSAVGGVLLLWIRGMPFSISAGVGFIALFGIAVLNGIVLIEHFKELKEEGITDLKQLIITGTTQRLRPVLLTASAAALGFLPMAVSTSAGAEVQRPLATVVIGGLITATLLTLIVLPVLFCLFDRGFKKSKIPAFALFVLLVPFTFFTNSAHAQDNGDLTLEEAIQLALKNNNGLRAANLDIERNRTLVPAAFNIDKTEIYYHFDESNLAPNNSALQTWGVQQTLPFPTVFLAQKRVNAGNEKISQQQYFLAERIITKEVAKAYYTIIYLQNLQKSYRYLDSIYSAFSSSANRKYELGESNYLEKLTAEARLNEINLQLRQNQDDLLKTYAELYRWMQTDVNFRIANDKLMPVIESTNEIDANPGLGVYKETINTAMYAAKLERNKLLPDLRLGYFISKNNGPEPQRNYNGYQVGIGIPLFFGAGNASAKAAGIQAEIVKKEADNYRVDLEVKYEQLSHDQQKYNQALLFYDTTGKELSEQILKTATRSFQTGEIDFFQYVQSLENARKIELDYLRNLHLHNQTQLEMNYLTL